MEKDEYLNPEKQIGMNTTQEAALVGPQINSRSAPKKKPPQSVDFIGLLWVKTFPFITTIKSINSIKSILSINSINQFSQ